MKMKVRVFEQFQGRLSMGAAEPEKGSRQQALQDCNVVMHCAAKISDLVHFMGADEHGSRCEATLSIPALSESMIPASGMLEMVVFGEEPAHREMLLRLGFEHDGSPYTLVGRKLLREGVGSDAFWKAKTRGRILLFYFCRILQKSHHFSNVLQK